jgi:hypothetical protein
MDLNNFFPKDFKKVEIFTGIVIWAVYMVLGAIMSYAVLAFIEWTLDINMMLYRVMLVVSAALALKETIQEWKTR